MALEAGYTFTPALTGKGSERVKEILKTDFEVRTDLRSRVMELTSRKPSTLQSEPTDAKFFADTSLKNKLTSANRGTAQLEKPYEQGKLELF